MSVWEGVDVNADVDLLFPSRPDDGGLAFDPWIVDSSDLDGFGELHDGIPGVDLAVFQQPGTQVSAGPDLLLPLPEADAMAGVPTAGSGGNAGSGPLSSSEALSQSHGGRSLSSMAQLESHCSIGNCRELQLAWKSAGSQAATSREPCLVSKVGREGSLSTCEQVGIHAELRDDKVLQPRFGDENCSCDVCRTRSGEHDFAGSAEKQAAIGDSTPEHRGDLAVVPAPAVDRPSLTVRLATLVKSRAPRRTGAGEFEFEPSASQSIAVVNGGPRRQLQEPVLPGGKRLLRVPSPPWPVQVRKSLSSFSRGLISSQGSLSESQTVEMLEGQIVRSDLQPADMRLEQTLCHLAEAIATQDQEKAGRLVTSLQAQAVGPTGTGTQRAAYYFMDALQARMTGLGAVHCAERRKVSQQDIAAGFSIFTQKTLFIDFANRFANTAILEATAGSSNVHVISLVLFPQQWPYVMSQLAARNEGPPHLRVTYVEPVKKVLLASEKKISAELTRMARHFGIPFEFRMLSSKIEELRPSMFDLREHETVAIHCSTKLHYLSDATVVRSSPRDAALQMFRELAPCIMVVVEQDADLNGPFFLARFQEAFSAYALIFDAVDGTGWERSCPLRLTLERDILARDVVNVVACEGTDRSARPERLGKWQQRIRKAGFSAVPASRKLIQDLKLMLYGFDTRWGFNVQNGAVQLTWKGRSAVAASAWRPVF